MEEKQYMYSWEMSAMKYKEASILSSKEGEYFFISEFDVWILRVKGSLTMDMETRETEGIRRFASEEELKSYCVLSGITPNRRL